MNESDRECEIHDGFCYTHQVWLTRPGELEAHLGLLTKAAEIGAEHGTSAGSWVVDGSSAREALLDVIEASASGEFFDRVVGEASGPLSGEYADSYSIPQLFLDVGLTEDGLDGGTNLGGGANDGLLEAYESAYWAAFEAEAVRSATAMLPDTAAYDALDQDTAYATTVFPGVAVRLDGPGHATNTASVVMVGDAARHTVGVESLTALGEGDYCTGCGQLGHTEARWTE